MIKKIKQLISKKYMYMGIIPSILIAFWIIASILLNNKISFSVLLYKQPNNEIVSIPQGVLLKGQKIKGEFRAKDNYLGLLMLRFAEYGKHDFSGEDQLIFRLKPHGDKNWSFSNTYRSGLLENNLLFPFGFPVINDSKDKVYDFEIESLLGNKTNGVEINRNSTALFSGYQYPKYEITKNKISAIKFILKKIITSFTNLDFLLGSISYLLPLLLYLMIYIFLHFTKKIEKIKNVVTSILFLPLIADIFIIKEIYMGVLIFIVMLWFLIVKINKKSSSFSFFSATILVVIWVGLIIFGINNFQNKINIWVYILMAIGIIHAIFEEKYFKNKKNSKK